MARNLLQFSPVLTFVAAASVGIVDGVPCLDLDYVEDSRAEVDMNLVMTGNGRYVEIQGTAEKTAFSSEQLQALLALGAGGIESLVACQKASLANRIDMRRLFPNA